MNKIGLEVREEVRELSDQDLDTVNGGFLPFLIAAAVVVAVDVGIGIYAATHNPNNK